MDKDNELMDEFEIIEEDIKITDNLNSNDVNKDWISEFTDVEKNEDAVEPPKAEEPLETIDNDVIEETSSNENLSEILDNEGLDNSKNNISYEFEKFEKEEELKQIETDLNKNRSVAFIVILFSILVLVVIMLPIISKILK